MFKPVVVGAAVAAAGAAVGWDLKLTPCLCSPFRLAKQKFYSRKKYKPDHLVDNIYAAFSRRKIPLIRI